jgi:hypothetical protein
MRYARPEFLETLANDTPLPMIVDAECGMPLDLGLWECLWTDDGDDSGESSIALSLAVACASRDCGDLSALSRFPDSVEPGPEEPPKTRPQGPVSAGGFDRWIVVVRQHFSEWFKHITCSAYCYVVTKNGVHNESRGDKPTQFDPRPVRAIFQFVDVRMVTSSCSCEKEDTARERR